MVSSMIVPVRNVGFGVAATGAGHDCGRYPTGVPGADSPSLPAGRGQDGVTGGTRARRQEVT